MFLGILMSEVICMKCCFCHRNSAETCRVNALYLCPDCLQQLMNASPADKNYPWFVSAMRRAMYA